MLDKKPIFGARLPVDSGHGRWKPRFSALEPLRSLVKSSKPLDPAVYSDTCWIGQCPKCGRTLISATARPQTAPDHYECGICD